MNAPGLKNLGNGVITAEQSSLVVLSSGNDAGAAVSYVAGLDGMLAATIYADFIHGSGGTSLAALVQTSLDQGVTWLDVARFDFTSTSATKVANLNGLLSKTIAAYAALAAEGVNDGILGPIFRAGYTSVGVYGNNTRLALRLAAR